MVSSLYIVLSALILLKLSLEVMKLRTQYQVTDGDGGFYALKTAMLVQGHAIEYIPISMLSLLMMEMNGAPVLAIHLCGLIFIIARILHYFGLKRKERMWRSFGRIITFSSMILMILVNIYYLPWIQIFSLDL
ncbi:MAG: MAPEG family protein [Candidatus Arsenophonus melophagi]|nr:MAPEG family protein [Candidatus Arsenophonus melophagi]